MKIKSRSIASLSPYDRNARVHSPEQIEQIAESIREFGFTNPILVTEDGMVVAGHGRLEAAKIVGCKEVPTLTVGADWSPEKVRAYVLADNQIALNSSWDKSLLAVELEELDSTGIDLASLGFSDADLAKFLSEPVSANDPMAEWNGMPEFALEDKTAFRTLPVHFKDQEAVDAFAKLIGQKITEKTRFVHFPETEIETYADKRYSADEQ